LPVSDAKGCGALPGGAAPGVAMPNGNIDLLRANIAQTA
jgi:hypothetical protein